MVRREGDSPAEVADGNSDVAEGGDADDDDYEEEYDITDYDEDAMYEEYESRYDARLLKLAKRAYLRICRL